MISYRFVMQKKQTSKTNNRLDKGPSFCVQIAKGGARSKMKT